MRLIGFALLACLGSTALMAGTIDPCTAELLSVYLTSTTGCQIGGFVFGSFYYNPTALGTGSIVLASQIMVTPILGSAPGLQFSANWTGTGNGGTDSEIGYHMATVDGQAEISETTLGMTGTATGLANALLGEYVCPGGNFTDLCSANSQDVVHLSIGIGQNPGIQQPVGTFGPVSTLSVLKDVRVYGDGQGIATLSSITNEFPTPEPVTPLLALSGLLVMWRLRKRRTGR
jgi:hypothetical protein